MRNAPTSGRTFSFVSVPRPGSAEFTRLLDAEKGIEGTAADFDAVSEFIRGLNNLVWSRRGWGRVVERSREGALRVELLGSGVFVDIPAADAEFPFEGTELISSEPSGEGVAFKLKF